MQYNRLNNLVGWLVFLIATAVYFVTLEDTASLWDCGEYITAAYKLEVGHPPGAPLFMLLGRLFSFFAEPEMVAVWINRMSALCSSFTILFMFWSITMLGKKIMQRTNRAWSFADQIAVLGAGTVGALAYTFSDSFWFSAVEGEVYAMSSLFTAAVFWAILKWDAEMLAIKHKELVPDRSPMRWMIFIMFMFGLAIGVHLLGLLAIPAIAYVIYFNVWGEKTNLKGIIICGLLSVVILAFIQEGLIPGTVALASKFEVTFVNSLGLPFNSGAIFFFMLLVAVFVWGIRYTIQKGKNIWNAALWGLITLFIGFGSFAVIVIRSNANTPLDENDPENLVTLHAYLKREQYGSWPILFGPYWNSLKQGEVMINGRVQMDPGAEPNWKDLSPYYLRRFVVVKGGNDVKAFKSEADANAYAKKEGRRAEVVEKYYSSNENVRKNMIPTYQQTTFLPRMYYSMEPQKIEQYKFWSGYEDEPGEGADGMRLPTFGENMRYMFNYQINYMYWRYFMWNFAGRQNDIQGHTGDQMRGNWLSGVAFADSPRLGNMAEAPFYTKDNPSYNRFFFLPLVLGFLGILFHFYRAPKDAFVVFLMFFFTGLAIVLYLNQKPLEPRERDYAYAASFYAFAIWIGIGVLALYEAFRNFGKKEWQHFGVMSLAGSVFFIIIGVVVFRSWLVVLVLSALLLAIMYFLRRLTNNEMTGALGATLIALIVPVLMAQQGWDDHDRSGKTSARDLAHNYLVSCAKNNILFTAGDNDTFPLWYYQEVENQRTDVRVCNLSLMQIDWYTDQMKRKAYTSEPLPIKFREDQILMYAGNTDQVAFIPFGLMGKYADLNALKQVFDIKVKHNRAAFSSSLASFRTNGFGILSGLTGADPTTTARLDEIKATFTTQTADSMSFEVVEGMNRGLREVIDRAENGLVKMDNTQYQQINQLLMSWDESWDYMPIDEAMAFTRDDANLISYENRTMRIFPASGFILPVDKDNAVKSGIITANEKSEASDEIRFAFREGGLNREQVMILDILANNDWKRAIYFSSPGGSEVAKAIAEARHLRQNGMTWEISPVGAQFGAGLNDEVMYTNLMEKYVYGGMEHKDVLTDYYARHQTNQFRGEFAQLAEYYVRMAAQEEQNKMYIPIEAGRQRAAGFNKVADSLTASLKGADERIQLYNKRAIALIHHSLKKMPVDRVIDYGIPNGTTRRGPDNQQYNMYEDGVLHDYVSLLYQAGDVAGAEKLGMQVADQLESIINFFLKSDVIIAGRNVSAFASAVNNYTALFKTSMDPELAGNGSKLGARTNRMITLLFEKELPRIYRELETLARENDETLRRGEEDAFYTEKLFNLRDAMEAIGQYYQILPATAPAGQVPNAPPAPADAILPAKPEDDTSQS